MSTMQPGGVPPCDLGVPPEEVAAWALDGEPYAAVDLDVHVPTCAACQATVAQVAPSRGFGERLRASSVDPAPTDVVERALGRVRAERTAWLLARTLGGAFARVASAAVDYAGRPPDDQDTAEFPPP